MITYYYIFMFCFCFVFYSTNLIELIYICTEIILKIPATDNTLNKSVLEENRRSINAVFTKVNCNLELFQANRQPEKLLF